MHQPVNWKETEKYEEYQKDDHANDHGNHRLFGAVVVSATTSCGRHHDDQDITMDHYFLRSNNNS